MSEPLSEDRLREIERQVEGDAVPSRGDLWKCSEDLLAEVRRLRALLEHAAAESRGLANDIREIRESVTGEQPHTPEEP